MKNNLIGSMVLLGCSLVTLAACQKQAPDSKPSASAQPQQQQQQQQQQQPAAQQPQPQVAPPVQQRAEPAPAPGVISAPASTPRAVSARATSRATQPVLRAVRSGKQPAADRLVFEFDGAGLPAWQLEYLDGPARDCGSGDAVRVAGAAFLQVRFTGARAHNNQGKSVAGPQRRALALPVARELVRTCDFEGEVTWVLGVSRPAVLSAKALSKPSRLVIDLAH